MSVPFLLFYLGSVFLFCFVGTGVIRRYSLRQSLIDVPNERSSHQVPTPRGGGLSISIAVLVSVPVLYYLQLVSTSQMIGLLGGGLLVSLVGWLDDHFDLPASLRAITYLAASAWAVYWLAGFSGDSGSDLSASVVAVTAVMILGISWLTNLYNFMDGTDAIAAVEAITAAGIAAYLMFDPADGIVILCLVVALSSAGFLCWNWPPARIFMGDVGSCLVGFVLGCLALITWITGELSVHAWLILLAVFIADASLTLLMRIARGERWYSAHRSHAYQRLVQAGMSHGQLAMAVVFINVLLLWPVAWLVHARPEFDWVCTGLVYMVMAIIWGMIQLHHYRTSTERRDPWGK